MPWLTLEFQPELEVHPSHEKSSAASGSPGSNASPAGSENELYTASLCSQVWRLWPWIRRGIAGGASRAPPAMRICWKSPGHLWISPWQTMTLHSTGKWEVTTPFLSFLLALDRISWGYLLCEPPRTLPRMFPGTKVKSLQDSVLEWIPVCVAPGANPLLQESLPGVFQKSWHSRRERCECHGIAALSHS